MQMQRVRTIAAAIVILLVSGCGRSNPPAGPSSNPAASNPPSNPASAANPLIGKWQLADQSENNLSCVSLLKVEFTEKTITTALPMGMTNTVTVTYGRDGDSYLASAGNGQAYRVKVESGGIDANGCHLVPASAKSNAIIGKWKPVPGQPEECADLSELDFDEGAMTMTFTQSPSMSPAVTYSRDADFYVVTGTLPSGEPKVMARVKVESGGIRLFDPDAKTKGCHLAAAS